MSPLVMMEKWRNVLYLYKCAVYIYLPPLLSHEARAATNVDIIKRPAVIVFPLRSGASDPLVQRLLPGDRGRGSSGTQHHHSQLFGLVPLQLHQRH